LLLIITGCNLLDEKSLIFVDVFAASELVGISHNGAILQTALLLHEIGHETVDLSPHLLEVFEGITDK
jgi:hypothetical protein